MARKRRKDRARSRTKRKRPEVKPARRPSGGKIKPNKSSEGVQPKKSKSAETLPQPVAGKVTLPRPNAIIMKIFGVMASYKFERDMIEYGKKNLRGYLQRRWSKDKIIPHLVTRFRKDAPLDYDAGDTKTPQIPDKGSDEQLQEAVYNYVAFKLTQGNLHVNSPIHLLNGWVVNEGYISGAFHTHVFKDAAKGVYNWRYGENYIKNYTLASAEREGQKNYIQSTCEGNLTACFNNYIPLVTERRGIEVKTYQVIETMIRDEAKNLLFISDNPLEIKAAHAANFMVVLIQRPGELKADPKHMVGLGHIPIIHSFDQLDFINDPNRPPPCC